MDTSEEVATKKVHRKRQAGRKAEKKNAKNEHVQELTAKQKNPKAFTFQSVIKGERKFRRKEDIQAKKHHVPEVDRTPLEPPPIVVAVVGPPQVGKSTLIRCLIKNFTKTPLSVIKGPVTLIVGKKRRITFIECNNDINSMIDIAKVADLVLLLIDASFGFEMEIFEFLNICQVHGMPKIMGVLTHLDMLKNNKTLKTTKKMLKHRFWTEVYAGAKLFYLSGIVHGEYMKNEVKNLGRFIAVMKFRPLIWQTTHSYVLADRIEDITPEERLRANPRCDRSLCLYGWARGIPLQATSSVHIPGCGDARLAGVGFLPDPCPLPEAAKKRSLVEKERLLYAPFSGVGGIVYDKDAVYVDLAGSHSYQNNRGVDNELVSSLMDTKDTIESKLEKSELVLFSNTKPIRSGEFTETGAHSPPGAALSTDDDDSEDEEENESDNSDNEEQSDEESSEDDNETSRKNSKGSANSKITKVKANKREQIENSDDSDGEENESEDSDDTNESEDESVETSKSSKAKKAKGATDSTPSKGSNSKRPTSTVKAIAESSSKGIKTYKQEIVIASEDGRKRRKVMFDDDDLNEGEDDDDEEENEESMDEDEGNESMDDEGEEDDVNIRPRAPVQGTVPAPRMSDKELAVRNKISSALASLNKDEDNGTSSESEGDSSSDDDNYEELRQGPKDSGSEEEEVTGLNWKSDLKQKAATAFLERQANIVNLAKYVYGDMEDPFQKSSDSKRNEDNEEEDDELGGMFKVVNMKQRQQQKEKDIMNSEESSKFTTMIGSRDWTAAELRESIKDCFVTGKWKASEDAGELLRLDDLDEDEEVFGDFEDLETGEKHRGGGGGGDEKSGGGGSGEEKPKTRAEMIEKKRKLKEQFDAEYDDKDGGGNTYYDDLKTQATRQAELNRQQFHDMDDGARVELEGYRAGLYIRLELENMPAELIDNFDPTYPLIVGGLQPGEETIGCVRARVKKHRWYGKILKTGNPVILSVGWRRFQTLPVYSKQEDNMRYRMLKYTPQHVACMAHFWGPITRAGTGFLAVQDVAKREPGFRVIATGTILDANQSTEVTKKLKLTGVPMKIYKKTAFVKDMFNSSLEVAKFEGAKIRTVSGIRGQIKKALNKPAGAFRATFEDKIMLSDIVFCRTWYKVDIPHLYNPVTSLLLPPEQKDTWTGMKTTGQLKRERGLQNQPQFDSMYTPIVRKPKTMTKLKIPKALQKELPYHMKPKFKAMEAKTQRVAVVRNEREEKVSSLMKMLRTNFTEKHSKERQAMKARMLTLKARVAAEEEAKNQRQRVMKKDIFRTLSKLDAAAEKRKAKGH
uniref:Ribosome biogenesis protein BMS1 homolog n=1 Tax=Cacopsylla melanoneura TaxID=428564 RepID=A0A8D8PLR9_9HEMI